MKKMRTLVAALGIGVLALVGCSSSSNSDRTTIPSPAEPENDESFDTGGPLTGSTGPDATGIDTSDRTPVRGSDQGEPVDADGTAEDALDAPNDMKKGTNKHDDGAPMEDESDADSAVSPDSSGSGGM
jgi:hypothetical protein